ncbi:MAG TPA: hypothetical protein VF273_04580 [Pelobium sp.]
MKKVLLIAILFGFSFHISAQSKETPSAYWVVESNLKTPKTSLVRFYNQKNEIIYQEIIANKRVNIERKKTKKALNKILLLVTEDKDRYSASENLLLARELKIR